MAKTKRTELSELLILLRRIVVLSVAAFGLFRQVPYIDLAVRLAILWAAAYLSGMLIELAVRHFTHRLTIQSYPTGTLPSESGSAVIKTERTK